MFPLLEKNNCYMQKNVLPVRGNMFSKLVKRTFTGKDICLKTMFPVPAGKCKVVENMFPLL